MSETMAVDEKLARAVERTRWAVLIWLLLCAIASQVLTPQPVTERGAMLGLAAALACAFLAVAARAVARSARDDARKRIRASLTAYAASALLGVVGLAVFFLRGDSTQALGFALGGAIFAAGGLRTAPAPAARPRPGDRR